MKAVLFILATVAVIAISSMAVEARNCVTNCYPNGVGGQTCNTICY